MTKLGNLPRVAVHGTSSGMATLAQPVTNDFAIASLTLSGWTALTGSGDNAETLVTVPRADFFRVIF